MFLEKNERKKEKKTFKKLGNFRGCVFETRFCADGWIHTHTRTPELIKSRAAKQSLISLARGDVQQILGCVVHPSVKSSVVRTGEVQ